MNTEKDNMVVQMDAYFEKIRIAISEGGAASFRYITGSVDALGQVIYDAPTELGFDPADYNVYSLGVQLCMVDPTVTVDPPVVEATAVLTYAIQEDGKLVIKSNFDTASVIYHARITMPVKK